MIKKLRWRFLWVSTVILALVISAVIGIVYWITSGIVMSQTRILMEVILENNGDLPEQWEYDSSKGPLLALNQESIYELRYLTALIKDEDAQITHMHSGIAEKMAEDIAEDIYKRKSNYGSISIDGGRRINFMKQLQEDGSTFIILLDSTSRYALIKVVMTFMTGLWLIVLVLYIIIMSRYSKRLVRPFEENDEKQKRFITNASHELKTPLAVISANTELIELVNGKNKWTENTKKHVEKLQNLIEDLVVLTRLDEMHEVQMENLYVSSFTSETVESFRDVAESSGRRFSSNIEQGLIVKTEKRSFGQLISILMDNATKYCDENGMINVELKRAAKGKSITFKVSNSYVEGKGVDYSCFFERFYREDVSHNSAVSGFGIGLSMGKEIAERLGGKLSVSYEGDMISFVVEL